MTNTRQSSTPQTVHFFSFLTNYAVPRSLVLSTRSSWVSCGRPRGAGSQPKTTSSYARLLHYSHVHFAGERLCRRGCGCSAACTMFRGLVVTFCDVHYAELTVVAPLRGVRVAHSCRRASTTSDFIIWAFRCGRLAFGRSYSSRV